MKKILLTCLFVSFASLLTTGCSTLGFGKPAKEESHLRLEDPGANISLKSIKRSTIVAALKSSEMTHRIRMVDVFSAGTEEQPEYRLFEIMPGSIYDELGLIDGDILLSCEGRFLVSSDLFVQYVSLLPTLPKAAIEIRRGTKVYSMRYTIQ